MSRRLRAGHQKLRDSSKLRRRARPNPLTGGCVLVVPVVLDLTSSFRHIGSSALRVKELGIARTTGTAGQLPALLLYAAICILALAARRHFPPSSLLGISSQLLFPNRLQLANDDRWLCTRPDTC